jgi:hypothetical protein
MCTPLGGPSTSGVCAGPSADLLKARLAALFERLDRYPDPKK